MVCSSAGIGRTGTFIAFDNLVAQAQDEGVVRPLQIVEALRRQQVHMVQTVVRRLQKLLYQSTCKTLPVLDIKTNKSTIVLNFECRKTRYLKSEFKNIYQRSSMSIATVA